MFKLKEIARREGWNKIVTYKTFNGKRILYNGRQIFKYSGKLGMPDLYSTDEDGNVFNLNHSQTIAAAILMGHPDEFFEGFSVEK